MAEEKEMPKLATIDESETGFNHDEHMAKVEEGLKAIIASEDINEIKAIAQGLLEEETKEAEAEEKSSEDEAVTDMALEDYGRK